MDTAIPALRKDESPAHRSTTAALTLAALGVVYGDIGTSPLYTIKEVFAPGTGVPLTPATVVGAVSVVFWLLMAVVTLKYVTLIMRASNRGEGGIMALLALASSTAAGQPNLRRRLLLLGAFGAALFYGDSVLTPAISVLSAVEGLEVVTPAFKPWVLPLAVGILVLLFFAQRRGTGTVGRWFGPVIIVWFIAIGAVGVWQIQQAPQVLQAIDPRHAFAFLRDRGWGLFLAVGAVVLAVTGAEALYADMGHFGKRPIRIAWTALVLPALALNYAGQGALLLREGADAVSNPFYLSFPSHLLLPAVAIATLATIIASQAVISGAFSLTQQAIQLGFLPRMQVLHTSEHERGQIYVPAVNWILLLAVVLACVGFGNSSAMASAYGIAVTGTMLITTVLTYFVVRRAWGFPWWAAAGATACFVALDAVLFVSCSIKVLEGGWFPLALALGMLVVMTAWKRGRELLHETLKVDQLPLRAFVEGIAADTHLVRVDRTAVFMSAEPGVVPQALLHNMKHNLVLHRRNLILTVDYQEQPVVAPERRVTLEEVGHGFWQVTAHFGFTERPDVPAALALCASQGLPVDPFATSFFLSRETVVPRPKAAMARWRQNIFETLSRNAGRAVDYFGIPHNGVIELGTRVQL